MSTETTFARLAIPVLAETEQEHAALTSARSRGYATGYADGRRAAVEEQQAWREAADHARTEQEEVTRRQIAALAHALRAAALELREATVPAVTEVEDALVEAAFELASVVVGEVLSDRVEAARAAVSRALSGETAGAVAVVRLNSEDLALLEATDVGAEAVIGGAARGTVTPRLVADPSLAPGDAIGELQTGWFDARVSTALARAREALS